jgi:hypothetical protein
MDSHSIAIFAFFFRYFSSTRPNEFFQIQAYLIHWFRLLALLFSLFADPPSWTAGHIACLSCQPSPALVLANRERDVAISGSSAIEAAITVAAALG